MKVYHVKTQADYDSLMIELEEKGYNWLSGYKPTFKNYWFVYKEDTCAKISGKDITFDSIESNKKECPDIPIIEYKAKGEKMTQEEMKQKLHENALDVFVKVQPFHKSISESDADLKEAKSSAKKLIENIDEYLESLKPKFNVGDYVIEQNGNVISKIGEVLNGDFWGPYYKKIDNYFGNSGGNILVNNIERYATPEEITEYESALSFHKHGRKPFELKRGDVIYLKGYDKNIFLDSGNIYKKHNFVNGDAVLVKTVEEVNEWLENK